jgi:Tfp pilus assembly protein PilF
MKEIYRKLILLGLVIFVGAGTFYTYQQGKKQDERSIKDLQTYNLSLSDLREEKYDEAQEKLLDLHSSYPDQADITWKLGLSYAVDGDMEKAALYYQKTVDLRPFIIQEPLFSLQFAEILISNEEYKAAKQYLEHCKAIGVPEDHAGRVDELLAYIESIK